MKAIYVHGWGLFTPGFSSLEAWLAGTPDEAVTIPPAAILPPTLRRRATSLTCLVATAAAAAAAQAEEDLSRIPLILGSTVGENAALAILNELEVGDGMPSPTRFHNSVHNGPIAYVSIATGNHGFSTAIAAGRETPAAALVEAQGLLFEQGGALVVVLADEPPKAPFGPARPYPPLAVALCLSASPSPLTRATLHGPVRRPSGAAIVRAPYCDHPAAGALALAAAIASGRLGEVPLGPEGPRGWVVEVLTGAQS